MVSFTFIPLSEEEENGRDTELFWMWWQREKCLPLTYIEFKQPRSYSVFLLAETVTPI
jgi:hypothetical protein